MTVIANDFCYDRGMKWVVGIDEVGRGPLAGPVYVCAAAMPLARYRRARFEGLRDSKRMNAKERAYWHRKAGDMKKQGTLRFALSSRSAAAIDARGISACIKSCIASALRRLHIEPSKCVVLLDGSLRAPEAFVSQQTIVRGDSSEKIISLAAVIAKVERDRLMTRLHRAHPHFCWDENKGYGTKKHCSALCEAGSTVFHRKTFISKLM